jgi:glutathione S-transferase
VFVLKLYDAARCPYCARVRIVLAEKGAEYEPVEIDLADRPSWIFDKNPKGKVPVVEEGGFLLPESHLIMEYLEERYPAVPLLPAGAADRALVRLRIDGFDELLGDAYYALRRGEDGAEEAFARKLAAFDAFLQTWRQPYGLADIAYVPWLVRARDRLGVDLTPYPALADWLERLAARPAIAAELDLVSALA